MPMAKFTVIEGRDPANFQDGLARRALRRFIVEILRALARGHDVSGRSAHELTKLFEHLSATDTSLSSIMDDVVVELHAAEYEDLARKWRELAAKVERLDSSATS
jgi:predicted component of type VI protein secretion system